MKILIEPIIRKLSAVHRVSIQIIEENVFLIILIGHWQDLLIDGQALRLGLEKIEGCLYFISRLAAYLSLDPQLGAFFDIIISASIDASLPKPIGD
jgi:hypothetical protein